ncbi:sulfatase family protein [Actinomadura oligospora]|uniref:sulfatase family protein n=1 Tax=Actinomadura oligospora TaxID=111804 RepID=UPI0004B8F890|nr:sulfatase [Actinomadura oligospora]
MKSRRPLLIVLAYLVAAIPATLASTEPHIGMSAVGGGVGERRPNIILVLADDLATADMGNFPNLARLAREGATLRNFIVSDSWCCPSRATILRSQYVHSHDIRTNTPPDGGYGRFHSNGEDGETLGTWMHGAGYRTSLIGKYLNGYPAKGPKGYVPPGWDDWHVPAPHHMYQQHDFRLVENGRVNAYHQGHLDDVLADKGASFIRTAPRNKPFFLYLAPIAPHMPAAFTARHASAFPNAKAPRPPSFDRVGSGPQPRWLRQLGPVGNAAVNRGDRIHRNRLRSMLSVDDMVGTLMRTLRETGRLDDTYLFFTSDNGFHMGQHRLWPGKTTPYEEDIRVPALVRGPGVRPGTSTSALAGTVDLAPTFTNLAGSTLPSCAEGRSLLPILKGRRPSDWRKALLVEFFAGHPSTHPEGPDCDSRPSHIRACPLPPSYAALRTERNTYVEYKAGERQLFDLAKDPYELHNAIGDAQPAFVHRMSSWLMRFRACRGATCRFVDRG